MEFKKYIINEIDMMFSNTQLMEQYALKSIKNKNIEMYNKTCFGILIYDFFENKFIFKPFKYFLKKEVIIKLTIPELKIYLLQNGIKLKSNSKKIDYIKATLSF